MIPPPPPPHCAQKCLQLPEHALTPASGLPPLLTPSREVLVSPQSRWMPGPFQTWRGQHGPPRSRSPTSRHRGSGKRRPGGALGSHERAVPGRTCPGGHTRQRHGPEPGPGPVAPWQSVTTAEPPSSRAGKVRGAAAWARGSRCQARWKRPINTDLKKKC